MCHFERGRPTVLHIITWKATTHACLESRRMLVLPAEAKTKRKLTLRVSRGRFQNIPAETLKEGASREGNSHQNLEGPDSSKGLVVAARTPLPVKPRHQVDDTYLEHVVNN
ncbi:uncharacterized protein LACBIDRAFT_333662 [Laccaria bicolor S238N-H82]|uniref:Predicted protein n=1 Tax=Laccaria bicolor (strain S238N-H82 / ATCC MYA-4686) TaxID=486041 RepID=B0DWT6_LACBS|nr:uncharacterized protein LACBIDRAFT_333662 [Laccaria bicolor S238N-H82]EDR00950.1 predicted protein [Laccaria bicolor S238N-H82]|eukprot:XP_001888345.1 predicted protein [Laccaria bicolor S238N-H82]